MATSLPLVQVLCTAQDQNGLPLAGGKFEATLDRVERYGGFLVPQVVTGIADASGACVLVLAGCGTARTVQVRVPVPVACQEAEPVRPVFPTESLAPGAPLFVQLRAALAEIDRREGFEVELLAALRACTAPLK